MNVVENERCQEKLRKTKLGMHFILDTSFICAGGEKDSDMCTVKIVYSMLHSH